MKIWHLPITLVALAFAAALEAATPAEWQSDVRAIVRTLEAKHPNPFTRVGERDFRRQADELVARIPQLTEEQRTVETMQLIGSIGDGHTQLFPHGDAYAMWYPVRLYEFTDGVFVTSAYRTVPDLVGAQVLEIGGRPAGEALALARTLMGADNQFGRRENLYAVSNAALMRGLGLARSDGALAVKVRKKDGSLSTVLLKPLKGQDTFGWRRQSEVFGGPIGKGEEWISAFGRLTSDRFREPDLTRPPHLRTRSFYGAGPIAGTDAFYIQINFVANDPKESFPAFFERALREVDRLKPKRLIVDWRYNGGGNGNMLLPMIHQFIKREDNPPWRELYVLSGRKTFSAAVMALDAFLDHTEATFVGEPPGSALNHFGDAENVLFPATGLELRVSTLWHQLSESDDTRAYFPLDVYAPFSFADYMAGRDPAVDPIVRGEEMRSIALIALADGGAAARRAYEQRKARFHTLEWWKGVDPDVIRRAGFKLLQQRRVADAVELFRINAEADPGAWGAWDWLAQAQAAAGDRQQMLESYRRSFAINPDNEAARQALTRSVNP